MSKSPDESPTPESPEAPGAARPVTAAEPPSEPRIEDFLGEPTRDLSRWAWLWTHDRTFPIESHRGGLKGRLVAFFKRLLRPAVRQPVADLWDRQRVFNLILLEVFDRRVAEIHHTLSAHADLLQQFDRRTAEAMAEVMQHNDALFSRVDQKLDRYRRESRELWHRLGALLVRSEPEVDTEASEGVAPEAADTLREQGYVAFEQRYRGREDDIAKRLGVYLPYLEGKGEILDLGCGRGESLEVFGNHGLEARGIDASAEMVARCVEKGLRADRGDLFEVLAEVEPGSLGAVVSFHVIEHLPAVAVDRLVRLAWRALEPGGVLILETPSPMALAMSARDFWIDPTHTRPVHPASLEVLYREAGFEPVERLDLHPFPDEQRLPEIDLQTVAADQRELADRVNRLRDLLDDLLFGSRDFALIGFRP